MLPNRTIDETPRSNNRGGASFDGHETPNLPMDEDRSESESDRDEAVSSEDDDEWENGHFDEFEDEAGSNDESYFSSSSEEEEADDINDDEVDQHDFGDNSRIEFAGMEAVEIGDEMKEETAKNTDFAPSSPSFRGGGTVRNGDDLLRQYMGVLHGGGRGEESVDGMENRISKGLSSHGSRSDFILNQSMSDMSVGSRSTRQSRREAVMVARRLDFLEDEPSEMTYTRQIALHLMKKYKVSALLKVFGMYKAYSSPYNIQWYNPRLGEPPEEVEELESNQMGGAYRTPDGYPMLTVKPENPSLEAAWAYFGASFAPLVLLLVYLPEHVSNN